MFDTYKMQEFNSKELEKKAESGLRNTTDLDTIWKLIDAYKNLLKIDMLQEDGEYSQDGGYSQNGDYSERGRRRDRMGRYARSDGHDGYNRGSSYHDPMMDYHDARHTYASTRTPDSKRDMTESLTECLHTMKGDLQDMLNGATTREERDKIKTMLREIGNLA